MNVVDTTIKIAIIGNSGVGKTAIATRYVNGSFYKNLPNVGVDTFQKQITCHGETVKLVIWDTAGQEKFRSMMPLYYHNANVIIIVYAVGNHNPKIPISLDSFNSVDEWYDQIKNNNSQAITVLCGNMCDLEDRDIPNEKGNDKAEEIEAQYFETSAATGEGIDELFESITQMYYKQCQGQNEPTIKIEKNKSSGSWCC
ncbi:small GTP-binding protein [Histomonas meleagridis]|uniref:small GTP-binding protein n=1 Tax=Histomonas meleagridis TaxID=135588 RepID=UPI00355A2171|nr:small GTP-binding protein [Histomonas meleagridis]KAH0798478.1 small GTP-binding protein [Histomonas meleagridis]